MTRIHFEGAVYTRNEGESVLEALLRGGANVPFSCRRGTCHVCMLQADAGEVGAEGKKGLRQALVEHKMFLPCCSHPEGDLHIRRPDLSKLYIKLLLSEKEWLSPSVCRLSFEPETAIEWHAGQFVNLRRGDGLVRSYSIASIQQEDYFLTVHVKRIPGGQMSEWLCDELSVGEMVDAQGPVGTCYYDAEDRDRNLLLLATGTGLSPLYGVCRDAIRQGHQGQIYLYHTSRARDGLYLRDELKALADQHERFHYFASLTQEVNPPPGVSRGRVVDIAFDQHPDLQEWMVYLCGIPDMVHEGRYRAVRGGAARGRIRADPFEYAHEYQPDDSAKVASIAPEPELWEALEHGPGLTEILTSFYDLAFADVRLAPFFQRITKDRAIQQQYAFLADLFSGTRNYFGLRPYNAHHWMVISDELFDYREALMEGVLREHGLSEALIRRWSALHELFRRDIVKATARGMIIDGQEQALEPPEEVVIEFPYLCDGCGEEMPLGAKGTFHPQGGKLFCARCSTVSRSG